MKANRNRILHAAALAGLMAFLAGDLILFGNCVIPTQDTNPEPVPQGRWKTGATGTGAILIPFSGEVEVRRGMAGDADLGLHAAFEELPPVSDLMDIGGTQGASFKGGENFAFGIDRKAVLERNGAFLTSLQYGLTFHQNLTTDPPPLGATVMAGLLFGNDWFSAAPRLHVGWQRDWIGQVELPLAVQAKFFDRSLLFQIGVDPASFLASGGAGILWPYQFVTLSWTY